MSLLDVTIEIQTDSGSALIRCGSCGVEQLLWASDDAAVRGAATAFTETHVWCAAAVRAALYDPPQRAAGD